jgi:hypothetical protein
MVPENQLGRARRERIEYAVAWGSEDEINAKQLNAMAPSTLPVG